MLLALMTTPVERCWQPSWLITFTFFRTQEAPRSFEEDLGTEVVFWFDAGRTATACKNDVYLFPIQLDEKVTVLHAATCDLGQASRRAE